ncbi:MAG: hypothetical protein WC254_00230 [Candidatus Woesearchaeota archaeon]
MNYDEENMDVISDIGSVKERKNLRTILNRGKMDKFELDEFLSTEV